MSLDLLAGSAVLILVTNPTCIPNYSPTRSYHRRFCGHSPMPVTTGPDDHRMGLAKAVVLEGTRHGGILGANVACVGSNQLFYQALGFTKVDDSQCWKKK